MDAVPVVDISPFAQEHAHDDAARARVAVEWDRAMTEVGFAIIQGHGVAPEVVASLRTAAAAFFSQEAAAKLAFNYGPYGNPLGGFTGTGTEAVSRSRDEHGSDGGGGDTAEAPADIVESFVYKPHSPKPAPEGMAEPCATYQQELLRVLGCLHRLTAASLGLPRDFFDPYYSPSAEVSLRLAYYPPVPPHLQTSSALRYGEHTDYTGFTILHQDEGDVGDVDAGGLQVLLKSGEWHAVLPRPQAFVVNIGDLYEVWTNGRWRSTVHRVIKPPPGSAAAAAPRLSLPFFTGPHNDAMITVLPTCVDEEHPARYEPITAGEHLRHKLQVSNT
jgi:isopenicillin N synthase-like dioxygenase